MSTSPEPSAQLYCATCEQQFTHGELCPNDGTRLVRLVAAVDPLLGRALDGRFTILEKLGQGGMGAVYRAKQHSIGREVAIKVVSPALTSDPTTIKRFLREAKLASRLAHPNIVSVFEFSQTADGVFYLVMELVDGRTLHQVIQDEGRITIARFVRIASQICDALEGAHALPIIHRDLKPANIMLLAQGRDLVKVLDFGLAKSLSPDTSSGTTMTTGNALMGTPTFMPPEVANGQAVDARSDLYSLGCILYLMGSGRPPFVSGSVPEMIAMHGTHPAPPMTGVPQPIANVVDRLLKKDPAERYPSAAALRTALEDAYDSTRTGVAVVDTLDEAIGDDTQTSLVVERDAATTPYLIPDVSVGDTSSLPESPSVLGRPSFPAVTVAARRRSKLPMVFAGSGVVVIAAVVAFFALRGETERPTPKPAEPPAPIIIQEQTLPAVIPTDAAEMPAAPPDAPLKRPLKRPKRRPKDGEAPF